MKQNTFNIELPFFAGFYESVYFNGDSIYNETYDEERMDELRERFGDDTLEADDIDIDFDAYKKDVCEAFVEAFKDEAPDFVQDIKMSNMTSPKYYNFETDRIWADLTLSDDWREKVADFMKENKDWLTEKIDDEWSDRDGFWSFLSNDYDEWYEELQKDEPDERYVGTMIGYIMYRQNERVREYLEMDTVENVSLWCYLISTKETA